MAGALENLLTDIEGVSVGHSTDLELGSGVTVIVFDEPAVASGSVLGGAPGGRETSLLDPSMTVEVVDALVLSGGSAFGLDAAGGVQAGLREIGRGFPVGDVRVPIVPQAIL
ncbi:MAG TPA: P1 family peptidase, partial [Rhizobium sp.]|nr:P1 family peptidase [Rhizobium sp.]